MTSHVTTPYYLEYFLEDYRLTLLRHGNSFFFPLFHTLYIIEALKKPLPQIICNVKISKLKHFQQGVSLVTSSTCWFAANKSSTSPVHSTHLWSLWFLGAQWVPSHQPFLMVLVVQLLPVTLSAQLDLVDLLCLVALLSLEDRWDLVAQLRQRLLMGQLFLKKGIRLRYYKWMNQI